MRTGSEKENPEDESTEGEGQNEEYPDVETGFGGGGPDVRSSEYGCYFVAG